MTSTDCEGWPPTCLEPLFFLFFFTRLRAVNDPKSNTFHRNLSEHVPSLAERVFF